MSKTPVVSKSPIDTLRSPVKDTISTNPAGASVLFAERSGGRMSPSMSGQKPVTPDSVKALMIIEAMIIAFFSFWLANEYVYNVYFRIYANSILIEHLTTYTIALGLGIGLAGTAAAATLYRNLREARVKLESVAPKIRGSVEKMLANVPSMEPNLAVPPITNAPVATTQPAQDAATTATPASPTPPLHSAEDKK